MNKLKKLRMQKSLTQMDMATKLRVSQTTYQRWEQSWDNGRPTLAADRLDAIAEILDVDMKTLMDRQPRRIVTVYNPDSPDDLSYYGEVAFHFEGNGESLLLSISDRECDLLYSRLQKSDHFITVRSLSNQTVILRRKAIADVFFSSEAFDDYGPETNEYPRFSRYMNAEDQDWQIIQAIAEEAGGEDDFPEEDVERIVSAIQLSEETLTEIVEARGLDPEEKDRIRTEADAKSDLIYSLATDTVWQFSNGLRRVVKCDEPKTVYEAFFSIVEYGEDRLEGEMIVFPVEGADRAIFVAQDKIDYFSIPSHLYSAGHSISSEEESE